MLLFSVYRLWREKNKENLGANVNVHPASNLISLEPKHSSQNLNVFLGCRLPTGNETFRLGDRLLYYESKSLIMPILIKTSE